MGAHSVLSDSWQPHGLQPTRLLLSMGFPRQEHGCGLPFPSPGDLSDPEIEPTLLVSPALAGGFFTTVSNWEAPILYDWGPVARGNVDTATHRGEQHGSLGGRSDKIRNIRGFAD